MEYLKLVETGIELGDAQEMAKLHPDTFSAPTAEELDMVVAGTHVKISVAGERFWVRVIDTDVVAIRGKIDNYLVRADLHNLSCDDFIEFERRHIYQVLGEHHEKH